MAASVALSIAAAMLAAAAFLSTVEVAGPSSIRVRLGGDVLGSGGPLTMRKLKGSPEAGLGMGVARICRSWRQVRSRSARTSSAGRTATAPRPRRTLSSASTLQSLKFIFTCLKKRRHEA